MSRIERGRAQEGVEDFQSARVAADHGVGPLLVIRGQRVEAGEPPQQLAGLGERQPAQVMGRQLPVGPVGQGERVPAGDQQPQPARPGDPGGEKVGKLRILDRQTQHDRPQWTD
jgi:hypothetical protein